MRQWDHQPLDPSHREALARDDVGTGGRDDGGLLATHVCCVDPAVRLDAAAAVCTSMG